MNEWLDQTNALPNLTIYFLPGDYMVGGTNKGHTSTSDAIWIKGNTNRIVRLVGIPDANGIRPRLVLGPRSDTNSWPNENSAHQWLIRVGASGTPLKNFYLDTIQVENLVLDGNFGGLGAWTSEANAGGYKSFALDLAAFRGRVRNVLIQNFGSVGKVPLSHLDGFGGVEGFPVFIHTFDDGQANFPGAPAPWIIEDVEVSNFGALHAGYSTILMPHVYRNSNAPSTTPVAIVRRCQVRGNPRTIGSGTGGRSSEYPTIANWTNHAAFTASGRILFEDNVFLNVGSGFNLDTGTLGPLVWNNNAFLDATVLGFLGIPDNWGDPTQRGLFVTNNLIRLAGRNFHQNYSDICINDPETAQTNPNLGLGRIETNDCHGLIIRGRAGDVHFQHNDLTTWPLASFFRPDPGNSGQSVFRPIWKIPTLSNINCSIYSRTREPVTNMVLTANRLSTVGYDVTSPTLLPTATYASFTPTSAPLYNDLRTAVSPSPGGFQPAGRLERVGMITNGSGRLTAVREVQIGQTSYSTTNNGTLTVVVRVADQRLAAGGVTGTLPVSGVSLRLTNAIIHPNGSVTSHLIAQTSTNNGTATFTLSNLAGIHGMCRLAAFADLGAANGLLDPDRDAWSSHSFPLGTTVELTASPDVGDDKNTASAKRARIRVRRSGPTSSSLSVNLSLHSGVFVRPNNLSDLAATYGTSGTADYYISNGTGTWSTSSPFTNGTITIPAGSDTADVQIVTREDNLTEQNIIVARLALSANYAPGLSTNVHVLIFDGPMWTLKELSTDNSGYYTINSQAYALNDLNGSTQPRAAGFGDFGTLSGTNLIYVASRGGHWQLPNVAFNPIEDMQYYGISTAPIHLVGGVGSNARVRVLGGSATNLPHLSSGPSTAWGIVSNAALIVGRSRNANSTSRPTTWVWASTNTGYTPFDVGGNLNSSWPGEAYGANLNNQVIGELRVTYQSGLSNYVAFRSQAGTSVKGLEFNPSDGAGDILRAPGTSGGQNLKSRGTAVNSSGHAVGWYETDSAVRRAVYWPSSGLGSQSSSLDLNAWKARIGTSEDSRSSANAISSSGWIAGWSNTNNSPGRAVLKRSPNASATDWVDLNDPHFTHAPSGWILKDASGINASGQIVGNGLFNGSQRAFVLIPRTSGN
ncbi:MAG: hypothetical protein KF791_06275 [Verrucomicrobiae bacterium]|nr:hypothetical protein [Verrucomicrobiae bacterium]